MLEQLQMLAQGLVPAVLRQEGDVDIRFDVIRWPGRRGPLRKCQHA